MRIKLYQLAAMLLAIPSLCLAHPVPSTDTVKVINHPNRVTITQRDNEVLLDVKGSDSDKNYRYEYRLKRNADGTIQSEQNESRSVEFKNPFKKRDSINTKPHIEVFLSGIYLGWGRHSVESGHQDAIKKSMSEGGILNLIGAGLVFNKSRSRLSIGMGFNWSNYSLHEGHFWDRDNNGVVGLKTTTETGASSFSNHNATLSLRSMQFPLLFKQSLGKNWDITAGAVLNWNFFADYTNTYRIENSDYNVTTRGLHQRKVSCDFIGMLTWHGLGAYFRYAPKSVFDKDFGPEMKNRWTLGVVVGLW
ncbi:MAG: hypothetical protein IKR25_09980 [Muribaculaceae bacterium]|nr:hypothetical protein [Muribaculaceae bacterium]